MGDTGRPARSTCYLKVEKTCKGRQNDLRFRIVGIGRTGSQLGPMYHRLPHGPSGMERDEVARNQRTRLYGGMIESVSQRGYHGDHRGARDRSGGCLAQGLLRAVPEQGSSASWRRTTSSSRALASACSTPGSGSADGRTACTPAARRCSTTSPRSPRDRGWCWSTRSASDRRRGSACSSPGLTFERLVAGAFQAAPDGVGCSRLTARGDRRRRPPRRVHADARAPRA